MAMLCIPKNAITEDWFQDNLREADNLVQQVT